MNKFFKNFRKLYKSIAYEFTSVGKEVRRIEKIERYNEFITNILGIHFCGVDSASFLSQYNEIVKKEIYKFKSNVAKPYILDCGANIGTSLYYFNKLYPNSEIIAFEADQRIFSILEKNTKKLNNSSIILINKAVWNEDGKIRFYHDCADGGSIMENPSDENKSFKEVETVRLRSFINKKVDFLKIDIEGAEVEVISDCADLLYNVERIFIEYHSSVKKSQELNLILEILTKNNFRYYLQSTTINNVNPYIKFQEVNNYDNLINIYAFRK